MYPEGTVTRDPQLWPMTGKTGAARVALTTGCPVIPVAQWGPQEMLWPYTRRPRLLPRKTMHVVAGPPVDLADLRAGRWTPMVLRQATARIMAAVTALLEPRGVPPHQPPASTAASTACRPPATRPARCAGGCAAGRRHDAGAVLGSGSWGTAFSMVLADAGVDVTMWGRRRRVVAPRSPVSTSTATTCPMSLCPRASWRPPTRPRRWTERRWSCSRCHRRRCARTSALAHRTCPRTAVSSA